MSDVVGGQQINPQPPVSLLNMAFGSAGQGAQQAILAAILQGAFGKGSTAGLPRQGVGGFGQGGQGNGQPGLPATNPGVRSGIGPGVPSLRNPSAPGQPFGGVSGTPVGRGGGEGGGGGGSATAGSETGGDSGYPMFQGVPGYPGQMTPDLSKLLSAGVYGAYQPGTDAGISGLGGIVSQPGFGQLPANYQQAFQNMMQYGVQSEYPGQMIHSMAQYGGTGGPGNYAMNSLLRTGSPYGSNPAGMGLQAMAQGAPPPGGDALAALANNPMGSPAASPLARFLTAQPYSPGWVGR